MNEDEFATRDGIDAVGIFDGDGKRHILARNEDGSVTYHQPAESPAAPNQPDEPASAYVQ